MSFVPWSRVQGVNGNQPSLAAPPTPGRLLTIIAAQRAGSSAGAFTGWTDAGVVTLSGADSGTVRFFYKTSDGSEQDVTDFDAAPTDQ